MNRNSTYTLLSVFFCVCLIASNIFETKIFPLGPITLTGGFLIFPFSYILNDCLSEVYGYGKARTAIFTAFGVNLFFLAMAQAVRALPEVEYGTAQEHLDYLFKADLRITCASMAAFFIGSIINAKVMSGMKVRQGEKGFWLRAIVSSLAGEGADSLIFFPIAFRGIGVRNIITLMITQVLLKTAYEVVVLPLTAISVKKMKTLPE